MHADAFRAESAALRGYIQLGLARSLQRGKVDWFWQGEARAPASPSLSWMHSIRSDRQYTTLPLFRRPHNSILWTPFCLSHASLSPPSSSFSLLFVAHKTQFQFGARENLGQSSSFSTVCAPFSFLSSFILYMRVSASLSSLLMPVNTLTAHLAKIIKRIAPVRKGMFPSLSVSLCHRLSICLDHQQ